MNALFVLGTRPEVIKLAPVIAACRPVIEVKVAATGQHREMLAQALATFGLVPDFAFDAMQPDQGLSALAARLIEGMDGALAQANPDWVIVEGDTTTAFAAGLAAFHRQIRVAHVEAGLRTHDLAAPFPEEANRAMLARLATLHFAPTERARDNLLAEGIADAAIHVTGNTIVDAVAAIRAASNPAVLEAALPIRLDSSPLILVTCHRRENFGPALAGICEAIAELAAAYPGHRFVLPLHPNPNILGPVGARLGGVRNIELIEPLDYPALLHLLGHSALVLTDSGGIQEEAPSFGVPVVITRELTERGEGIEAGFATLAGRHPARILAATRDWLDHPEKRAALAGRPNPYGDGHASTRIRDLLLAAGADHG